jgi:hypothetical protein
MAFGFDCFAQLAVEGLDRVCIRYERRQMRPCPPTGPLQPWCASGSVSTLKALIVGAFVRGLSMRDVESLCEEAGLGKTSKSTVALDSVGYDTSVRSPAAAGRKDSSTRIVSS